MAANAALVGADGAGDAEGGFLAEVLEGVEEFVGDFAFFDDALAEAGAVAEDLESMQRALDTEEWLRLKAKLMTYVTDYDQKIVRATGGFQL